MDSVFLLTLGFIFLTALVGIYLKRRARDRCLKDFNGFSVTVSLKDSRRVWGRLSVFPNDLEIFYARPNLDKEGHTETSFVLFADQMAQVQAVHRYHDELTAANQAARLRDIERSYHPNVVRRGLRGIRNFLNTFSDAFNQSIGAMLAQAKKSKDSSAVVQTQDKHLTSIGSTVLGAVANAYEPVLERYIGRRVVVEERQGERWVERVGILKEYTSGWIELLDCREANEYAFQLAELNRLQLNRNVDFVLRRAGNDLEVTIENHGQQPIEVRRMTCGDAVVPLGERLDPGGRCTVSLATRAPEALSGVNLADLPQELALRGAARATEGSSSATLPALPVTFILHTTRAVDLCLPRAHAVLRHGGEPIESWRERLGRRRAGS